MAPRSEPPAWNLFLRKNKNRGAQVVKPYVPFLLFVRARCRTKSILCRAGNRQSKPCCRFRLEKENGMEELGVSSEVLQEPPQPWLDLTNLAVTKEYHSLS